MATPPPLADLPLQPPVSPMLAAASGSDEIPVGPDLAYEPKWDGFRILIFRSGDEVVVQGRSGDDLSYAFPEVVSAARDLLPQHVVLDGELVIITDGVVNFPAMGTRIRPRSEAGGQSIEILARSTPATFVAFDLLVLDQRVTIDEPYGVRRELLAGLHLDDTRMTTTPTTMDLDVASRGFRECEGGGLDGLIVKSIDAPYSPGKRTLRKVKHHRTLDVVVAGWRGHSRDHREVGSLLLGLYDMAGLQHIGVTSGFNAALRRELTERLTPLTLPDDDPHPWRADDDTIRQPGGSNRWSRGRDQSWHALPPDLVAEVGFDQFEGHRLRHVARWLRWRPDRDAGSCTWDQVPAITPIDMRTFLAQP